jgi:hypothetical protein
MRFPAKDAFASQKRFNPLIRLINLARRRQAMIAPLTGFAAKRKWARSALFATPAGLILRYVLYRKTGSHPRIKSGAGFFRDSASQVP